MSLSCSATLTQFRTKRLVHAMNGEKKIKKCRPRSLNLPRAKDNMSKIYLSQIIYTVWRIIEANRFCEHFLRVLKSQLYVKFSTISLLLLNFEDLNYQFKNASFLTAQLTDTILSLGRRITRNIASSMRSVSWYFQFPIRDFEPSRTRVCTYNG